MYPFADDIDTFAMNQWYIGAWSSEVTSEKPFERRVAGKRLVFYRKQDGTPVALDGLCPHRQYQLVKGDIIADQIVCKYHGFTFGADGKCTRIPTQSVVPSVAHLQSYPLVEKWKWIWVWPGNPELADPSMIPDHREISLDNPDFEAVQCFAVEVDARYGLLHENLLDLSHISYLHWDQMGVPEIAETPVTIEEHATFLRSRRLIKGISLSPVFVQMTGYEDKVDRSVDIDFHYPALHISLERWDKAGHALDDDNNVGIIKIYHGITPATTTSTTYFVATSRSFRLGDEDLNAMIIEGMNAVVAQDEEAVVAIEQVVASGEVTKPDILAKGDAAAVRGRRILERLIRAEHVQHEAAA